MPPAGQHVVHGDGVRVVRMRDRPHQRIAVGQPGEPGNVLADIDTGDVGRNRFELAANLGRSFRLEIPRILMRRRTEHKQHNARLRPSKTTSLPTRFLGIRPPRQQPADMRPKFADARQPTNPQPIAARNPFTRRNRIAGNGDHAKTRCGDQSGVFESMTIVTECSVTFHASGREGCAGRDVGVTRMFSRRPAVPHYLVKRSTATRRVSCGTSSSLSIRPLLSKNVNQPRPVPHMGQPEIDSMPPSWLS